MISLVAPFIAACAPVPQPQVAVPPAVVLGQPYDPANAFALKLRGQGKDNVVYEDARVLAFMDYSPVSPGHVLVISKRSRGRNLLEMSDRDLSDVMKVARRVGRAEISGLGADGFTIEQNNGYSQSVPHLHVHVVPRYLGYWRCPGSGLRQSPQTLEPFATRLRVALAADRGQPIPPKPADDLSPPAVSPVTPYLATAADPRIDTAHPAAMVAFRLPSHGVGLNAVMYAAAGAGPHPTMLLLHGFPGNEQNLDLAQAVRRAGWNVVTLHYRGSWGSPGDFSFHHSAEDAAAALSFLRSSEGVAMGVDTARIVVAGHSMGGMMAASAAARDPAVAGTVLLDAWDIAADARRLPGTQAEAAAMIRSNLPGLSGTSEAALLAELSRSADLDLREAARTLAPRPLLVVGAERAGGATARSVAEAARGAGGSRTDLVVLPTDHSFSDQRIALSWAVVNWLNGLQK